jgi:hypothetical protein
LSAASFGPGRRSHTILGHPGAERRGSIEARLSLPTFFGKTKKVGRRQAKEVDVATKAIDFATKAVDVKT